MAGTHYDFEDEFDDEFGGTTKEPEVSLNALREQSKKQNLPIYMQNKKKGDGNKDPFDDFGFEDQIPPVTTGGKSTKAGKKGRGNVNASAGSRAAAAGGRGRGRGRQAAAKNKTRVPSFDFEEEEEEDDDDDENVESEEEFFDKNRVSMKKQQVADDMPKLPKLKLGAMLKVSKSKEVKKDRTSNSSRRRESNDSLESSEAATKVPKLKIKLGPKPESKAEVNNDETDSKSENLVTLTKKQKISSSSVEQALEAGSKLLPNDVLLEHQNAKDIIISNDVKKPSPASSPTKKGSRIDSLAEKLLKATGSSSSSGSSNELVQSIFGPSGVPLDMTNSGDNISGKESAKTGAASKADETSRNNEAKSELDLIREEIEGGGASVSMAASVVSAAVAASKTPSFIQSSPAGASPHADTVYAPLKKAINASRSAMEKDQAALTKVAHHAPEVVDNYDLTRKHLKFKFKNIDGDRHSTSTPPPNSSSSVNPPSSASASVTSSAAASMIPPSSTASSNATSMSHYKPMNRKKAILNQYYGQDIYSAPTNGPTSGSASNSASGGGGGASGNSGSSSSNVPGSYDSMGSYAGSSDPPPAPRPVIKMPKAVASVTSVPTRADYQQQLEANLERKRKREKGEHGHEAAIPDKGKKGKKGKKNADDDDYRPKIGSNNISDGHTGSSNNSNDKARKTRGKPPKKCLAESPEHEPDDLKAASMKYAEAIRAQFDEPSQAKSTSSSSSKKKSKTNKRKAGPEDTSSTSNNKTPRLVIKFSKDSSTSGGNAAASDKIRENGGRDEYDFDDDNIGEVNKSSSKKPSAKLPVFVDGTMDSSSVNNSPAEPKVILPKLKIKI